MTDTLLSIRIRGPQMLVATNKSGGALVKGDVVIVDTGNDSAVVTTTTAQSTRPIGVVAEPIANNATGHIAISGLVDLVNVTASVTRGHYAQTSTTVKKATGNAARQSGSFAIFLSGGTTPVAWLFGVPDGSGGGGGGGSMTVEQTGGSPSTASVSVIEVGSYTDNGGGDVTLFPQITGTGLGALVFASTHTDVMNYNAFDGDGTTASFFQATDDVAYIAHTHTPGDLAGTGIQMQVGADYVGLYVSEKDSSTVQIYPDDFNDHAIELVDRGSSGRWIHVSEAGDPSIPALGVARRFSSAPSAVEEGEHYYDTTTHKEYVWNGTSWNALW